MMNQPEKDKCNWDDHDEFDAVIMALDGTNNYGVEMWWLESFRIVAMDLHPELEAEVREIINYLDDAVHRHHPDIIVEMWNNRTIKY